jgi:hypothetical protein
MKSKSPTDPAALERLMIAEAADHVQTAENFAKGACKHALLAGMRLIWLHAGSNAQGSRNDFVSRETKLGFEAAIAQIGLKKATAYRWMAATLNAADSIGISPEHFPQHGTANWNQLEDILAEIAGKMSLRRLVLGSQKDGTEDQRQEHLIAAAENGQERAEHLLDGVASGKYTLVQAVRALGSQEAYDRLKAEGGEKVRKDPVYLEYDFVGKCATGLMPKALTTLSNGFKGWQSYDEDAKERLKADWIAVVKDIPSELLKLIKVGGVA